MFAAEGEQQFDPARSISEALSLLIMLCAFHGFSMHRASRAWKHNIAFISGKTTFVESSYQALFYFSLLTDKNAEKRLKVSIFSLDNFL